jgi:hypothetical protein
MKTFKQNTKFRFQYLIVIASLMLALVFTGCDDTPSEYEDYEHEPVLTGFITVNEPVEEIFLDRVGVFTMYYSREANAISDAEIILFPVGPDAETNSIAPTNTDTLYFVEDDSVNGRYVPVDPNYLPEGRVRYRIEARKASENVNVWAETTVPDTFSIQTFYQHDLTTPVDFEGDTLRRTDDEFVVTWSESATADGHVLGILALSPKDELVPLDPDWDPDDPDDEIDEEDKERYGYTIAPDYQSSITMAWFYFEWAGWTRLDVYASSYDYYNYIFSILTAFGETDNPYSNINGGRGIFGAVAKNEFMIYMERALPEE